VASQYDVYPLAKQMELEAELAAEELHMQD
jgi:hypothetical protein